MAKQQQDNDTVQPSNNDENPAGQATAPRDDSRSPEQGLADDNHGDQTGTDPVRYAIENSNSGPKPRE